jgi:hypothetical protein
MFRSFSTWSLRLAVLAAIAISPELFARWWMSPPTHDHSATRLAYRWNGVTHRDVIRKELPELLRSSISSLKCSSGSLARLERPDGVSIHVAFFEWDSNSQGSPLEAFKHLPEQCLGSLGMTWIKDCGPHTMEIGNQSLVFEHLLFRDFGGSLIHSFKAVAVTGATSLTANGARGGIERWRELRWTAAKLRFKPSSVAVVQGAVRDVVSPNTAWTIFQENILPDLVLEPQSVP